MTDLIGPRLRDLRTANRMSITDLSERTGVSRAQISLIENDKVDPRFSTIVRLLTALGADLSDLQPRVTGVPLETIRARAALASRLLEDVGLGPSGPELRLDQKEERGVDVTEERRSLATRR